MDLEIEKSLVISTAHVTQEDMELLTVDNSYPYTVHNTEYGAMVYIVKGMLIPTEQSINFIAEGVYDEKLLSYSLNFRKMLKLAQDSDCTWLRLDCDGTVHDELPNCEW